MLERLCEKFDLPTLSQVLARAAALKILQPEIAVDGAIVHAQMGVPVSTVLNALKALVDTAFR